VFFSSQELKTKKNLRHNQTEWLLAWAGAEDHIRGIPTAGEERSDKKVSASLLRVAKVVAWFASSSNGPVESSTNFKPGIAAMARPPSLKGILSTNDDPSLCEICSEPFPSRRDSFINMCCGKEACDSCTEDGSFYDSKTQRCLLCQSAPIGNIGLLKKQAKRGRPWAQFGLGRAYSKSCATNYSVSPDDYEAVRWYRKAVSQGHPIASYCLACCYLTGTGCTKDLIKAKKNAEKALSGGCGLEDEIRDVLLQIGTEFTKACLKYADQECTNELTRKAQMKEAGDEAESILIPLVEVGMPDAQYELGKLILLIKGDFPHITAMRLFVMAAAQGHGRAALFGIIFANTYSRHSLGRFWLRVACNQEKKAILVQRCEIIHELVAALGELRMSCGGCGTALDGATRKLCKGCKTYCYCSRECQKLHWNLPDGHRSECLEVTDLSRRMKQLTNN